MIRHREPKRNPIKWMDDSLEKARKRDLPTKAETGFVRLEKQKHPNRYDKRNEEGRHDQK